MDMENSDAYIAETVAEWENYLKNAFADSEESAGGVDFNLNALPHGYDPIELYKILQSVRNEYTIMQMEIDALKKENEESTSQLITIFQDIFRGELNRIAELQNKSCTMKKYEDLLNNFMTLNEIGKENLMFAYDSADKTRITLEKRTRKPSSINPAEVLANYESFTAKSAEKYKHYHQSL